MEKLLQKGLKTLSDVELLAILLDSGTKDNVVMVVAAKILIRLI